jgi:hypothetical protein
MHIYSDMLPVLKDQVQHIKDDDIAGLDETLKRQQVMVLKTKNFDEKVGAFLSDMGISANTLTETIEQLPDKERFRFYSFLGEFDYIMEEIAFYKNKCRELLQTKLYRIEYQIERSGLTQATSYDENAGEINTSSYTKHFEKMI